jgi:hypothetical protein
MFAKTTWATFAALMPDADPDTNIRFKLRSGERRGLN